MPRKIKILPADREQWSFGGLVFWHFFIHGTWPEGKPGDQIGRLWKPKAAMDALGINSPRTFWNWIDDDHFPYDTIALERVLFGNSSLFDSERLELQEKLRTSRAAKAEQARSGKRPKSSGAGSLVFASSEDVGEGETEDSGTGSFEIVEWRTSDRKGFAHDSENEWARTGNGGTLVALEPVRAWWSRTRQSKSAPYRTRVMIVAVVTLLLGGYAWTYIVPTTPQKKDSTPGKETQDDRNKRETEARARAKAEADRVEAERQAKEAADRQKKDDDTRLAEEKRKASKEQARARAEQRYQLDATKDAVEQKRMDDQANAQALNAKLKVWAQADGTLTPSERPLVQTQADGNDLCKQKLEGVSVPDFTLKCDTLIPFGAMLGNVPVSQTASSLADCAARCRKAVSPKCVAFSFDAGAHTGSASCYLSGSITTYNPATNWIAGTR